MGRFRRYKRIEQARVNEQREGRKRRKKEETRLSGERSRPKKSANARGHHHVIKL